MTCCLQVGAKEIQNRGMLQVNMIDKLLAKIIFNQLNQFKREVSQFLAYNSVFSHSRWYTKQTFGA